MVLHNTISTVANAKSTTCSDIRLGDALDNIRSGLWRENIEHIRNLRHSGQNTQQAKQQLPGFLFSGTFSRRRAADLKEHSGILCLDFDAVDDLDLQFNNLREDPHCLSVFRSPSGNGLKVLVPIQPDPSQHGISFQNATAYFYNRLGMDADPNCKDISRLCFASWDPNLHINEGAVQIALSLDEQKESANTGSSPGNDILSAIKAESRHREWLKENAPLDDIWEIHVRRHFNGGVKKRYAFIQDGIPHLFYRTSPKVISDLSKGYFDAYSQLFHDTRDQHIKETNSMLEDLENTFIKNLRPEEAEVYSALSDDHKAVFRIARDLAIYESENSPPKGVFDLACGELQKRLGLKEKMTAWRILKNLEDYEILSVVSRGRPRAEGQSGQSTRYRWFLSF